MRFRGDCKFVQEVEMANEFEFNIWFERKPSQSTPPKGQSLDLLCWVLVITTTHPPDSLILELMAFAQKSCEARASFYKLSSAKLRNRAEQQQQQQQQPANCHRFYGTPRQQIVYWKFMTLRHAKAFRPKFCQRNTPKFGVSTAAVRERSLA